MPRNDVDYRFRFEILKNEPEILLSFPLDFECVARV